MIGEQFNPSPGKSFSDEDYDRLIEFVQMKYGIDLHQKRQLIASRLGSTIKKRGFGCFSEYVDYLLTQGTDTDINQMMSKLTTNYTYFMREVGAFNYFKLNILPNIVKRHKSDKCLSIWSAGCSTGEEPYNLSMYIKDYLGAEANFWDTRLLATDISTDALSKAQKGVYRLPDTIPEKWRQEYFVPVGNDYYVVAQSIKNNVIFRQFNLMDEICFKRQFDVIFCRNVMIYFDQPTKKALTERLYDATVPGGYLVISTSENLNSDTRYQRVSSSVFQKKRL